MPDAVARAPQADAATGLRLLNVGCGTSFHASWTNIDLVATSPEVIAHDLREGLPFPDATFDAVYSSHVLEHVPETEGRRLLREMARVTRTGGIVRVVVPDLEGIVRAYLDAVERVDRGVPGAQDDHEWMIVELIDQMVRVASGGRMAEMLRRDRIPNRDFIVARLGWQAENFWRQAAQPPSTDRPSLRRRVREMLAATAARVLRSSGAGASLREARFRSAGEVHRWMYDRHSLRRLLEGAGFHDVRTISAWESRIPEFDRYGLDAVGDRVRKPDSLFVEAARP